VYTYRYYFHELDLDGRVQVMSWVLNFQKYFFGIYTFTTRKAKIYNEASVDSFDISDKLG